MTEVGLCGDQGVHPGLLAELLVKDVSPADV